MKGKTKLVQQLIWGIFVGYHIIETIALICADDYSTGLLFPRMFVYYATITEQIVNQGHLRLALLWQHTFVVSGVYLLLMIPTCVLGIPKTFMHGTWARIVKWDIIILILLCTIDIVGCVLAVEGTYHPDFSAFLDLLVIAHSGWSLHSIGGQVSD